ncbi:MAG TPA: gephyrin-like molybdotransferase Glp [Actinomycetota bacterium]|nr:gephyrin-like molybdotransferase Glp [Actinomycetota bacterium]
MRPLLSIEQYQERILAAIPPPRARAVPLDRAYSCVAARSIAAPGDLPTFASSAMDGFAVRSSDLSEASAAAPIRLEVVGEVRMGAAATSAVAPGQAVAVPTGAMMPHGADTVVPVELCTCEARSVLIPAPSPPARNVRPPGEDLLAGEVLVDAGRLLEAADLGALAAAGVGEVEVFPKPTVVVFSTGNELVEADGTPGPGQIYESNSFMLRALVSRAGGEPVYAGRVPDDPEMLLTALSGSPDGDVLLCSGGVSAGREDPVKLAFAGTADVSGVQVAVQPGRPQAFGRQFGKTFFGLPGNPMASLVSFELFVRPALQKMRGLPAHVTYLEAVADCTLEAAPHAVRFIPVRLTGSGALVVARSTGLRRSNQLARLARADGLAEIPAGRNLGPGDRVRVLPTRGG